MAVSALVIIQILISIIHAQNTQNYEYWCTGNCDKPVNTKPHPGLILMGGGTDVDAAFIQQIKWSDCGDFLVIRSTKDNKYDRYIYDLDCANSASTLYIKNKNGANEQFVIDKINGAEAIFFAGGDQYTYLTDWNGTKLQSAVQSAIDDRNVPIGGTSAGCDIQGNYIYTAANGSVTSVEADVNPYNEYMTFTNGGFITQKYDILKDVIVDTHFVTRKRFGRLLAFVARLETDLPDKKGMIKGIGINEQTAFAIDLETNMSILLGPEAVSSEAYIINFVDMQQPEVCQPHYALTFTNVTVQKMKAVRNDTFDFGTWTGGEASERYQVSMVKGEWQSDPY